MPCYGKSSSLPVARQSTCAGKSCNDRGGWTRGGLLSNELMFWENEFDYETRPTTYEIKFASISKQQHLSFKHGQGCAIIQTLGWHMQVSLLFPWQVKQPQESGWVEPGGVGGWGWQGGTDAVGRARAVGLVWWEVKERL